MTGRGLTRGEGTALWRQIAERLRKEMRAGRHRPEERLPPESRLAAAFGVNRHTVRQAMRALEEEGLIRIEQGRGTFVQEAVLDYRVKKRTRFSENVLDAKREPSGKLLRIREEPAGAAVADALQIAKGAAVLVIERVGETNGRPISVASHYFPRARFPQLADVISETRSVSAAMERLGAGDYTRKITRVTARTATAADARLLQQPATKPVLVTEGINVDASGKPIEFSVARWAPDRVQIVFEPEA